MKYQRILRHQETLLYYDSLQLFLGRDQLNTQYLCLLSEIQNCVDIYLCAPISTHRVALFINGQIDLREIFTKPETNQVFSIETRKNPEEDFFLEPINPNDIPERWLPEPGFTYPTEKEFEPTNSKVVESREKHRALVDFSLNPPEARQEPKIKTLHLAEGLLLFQGLIKNAYNRSLHGKNLKNIGFKPEIQPIFEAYATSPGSFIVHLQSEVQSDLFGYVEVARAFEIIDEITDSLSNYEKALTVIKNYKGHLAASYIRLLEFLIRIDSPISYEWIIPAHDGPITHTIQKDQAEKAYELFSKVEDLGSERVEFTGKLTKVDINRKTWKAFSEIDKKVYRGSISQRSNITLSGAIIDTQIYRFVCEEKTEEVLGSGKETIHLYLIQYDPII